MIDYTFIKAKTLEEGFRNLYDILTALRSEDGCPWDREQTPFQSAQSLLEETYEYIDAYQDKDLSGCTEEIGDVLLNALMILNMHEEYNDFVPIDALNMVCEKLIRRHPHVFSDVHAQNSAEVLDIWNAVKETEVERSSSNSFFEKIPKALPTLDKAYEIQKKMQKVGFDWPDIEGVFSKVLEEIDECRLVIDDKPLDLIHLEEEIGDLLFSVVNIARFYRLNPSVALHKTNQKVMKRFETVIEKAHKEQTDVNKKSVDRLNELWEESK
ncbi:MAG: nucleoside triphosphate pyrophosphohydrolase [Sphaerochaetaceae bacterium]